MGALVACDARGSEAGAPPAQLDPSDLVETEALEAPRRKLVEFALKVGRDFSLDRYLFGSADPAKGGFDCSGAMYYVLRKAGLAPPRTSSGQFDWIDQENLLVRVPPETASLDDEIFSKLKPGDLLFWSGTYRPADGRKNGVTHVQMFLGTEKEGGRRVMIGSSDGRTYPGKRQCGYGVFDLRLPRKGSKSHLVGFGSPPGLLKTKS